LGCRSLSDLADQFNADRSLCSPSKPSSKNICYYKCSNCINCFSFVVAVVVLLSFSAGLLVPFLIFREGKHVPNLLVVFLGSEHSHIGEERRRELRRSCSVCGGEQCSHQLPTSLASPIPGPHHPHVHITVPRCVDDALDELLTLVLDEHVYSWYREFSVHDQLADEVRYVIRYAVCVLHARLQEVDLTRVITERLLPSLFSHLDQYVEGGRRVRMAGGVEAGVLEYTRRAGWLHPAMESREAEAQYLRSLVRTLETFLLPQKYQGSSVTNSFLKELLGRFLLLQLMDYLADPDTVNLLLLLLLNPDYLHQQQQRQDSLNQMLLLSSLQGLNKPHIQEPKLQSQEIKDGGSSVSRSEQDLEPVLLLKSFSSVNTLPRNSSLRNNLSAVLKDQTLLYLFHTFLKEESAINILQFCLAVEDFNRHILDPDLSGGELQALHGEAQDLYHSYMANGAFDFAVVHSEASAIVKLRTTRPLFQAYEFAYNLLEREYLPLFLNSHMYFAHLCGSRSSQGCQKSSSRSKDEDMSSGSSFFSSRKSSLRRPEIAEHQTTTSATLGHTRSSSYGGNFNFFDRGPEFSGAVKYTLENGGLVKSFSSENTEKVGLDSDDLGNINGLGLLNRSKSPSTNSINKSTGANNRSSLSRGVVQRVGSVGRSLKTFGASMIRPQVVAGNEDLTFGGRPAFYTSEEAPEEAGSYADQVCIDVTRDAEGCEETHWEVLRRFHEFYILESKLTEFHGEFQYNTLPSRRSLFTPSHASDFMLTRRQIFEEYLQKLLQTPALRRSQLLFLFLKSKDEFTSSFLPDVSLGRLLRDVPRKLVKERGQHLEPFIELFLQSAGPLMPAALGSKSDSLEEATEAREGGCGTEELYPLHTRLYGDNARSLSPPPAQCLPSPPPSAVFTCTGITEMILFIGVRVYGLGVGAVRWLVALRSVVGATVDAALMLLISRKLSAALTPHNLVRLIHLLRDALIEPGAERSSSARRRRELELRAAVLALLPPWGTRALVDDDSYREGANTLVNLVQHPLLNKQLSYVLLDQVVEELFPELGDAKDDEGVRKCNKTVGLDDTSPQSAEQEPKCVPSEGNID
ncbi:sorting nexin-14, partial [Hyalella azteca]|uniref:Sorting nexin-14 n=1 Tax=Hyalella azteca TaxID=294128 RepID=A0A979FFE3_HYAAZ